LFAKSTWNAYTNRRTAKCGTTSKSAWIENVYLDLDVILAELKAEDWLASDVDIESMAEPKASVATGIELQYVMEDEWERARVVQAYQEIASRNIKLAPLTSDIHRGLFAVRTPDKHVPFIALQFPMFNIKPLCDPL